MAHLAKKYAPDPRPAIGVGVAVCIALALLGVAVRGVRWDETYEHAQILTEQVVYPVGHPLAVYVHNAFSLQTALSGLMVHAGAGPLVLCGFRNVLFLLASILPVYLLGALLCRSAVLGLFGALFMLQGILLEFDGSYPSMVWPELYSNGHVGGGAVLLGLVALVADHRRTACFLAGLLPCIHVGQWPPLAGTVAVFLVYRWVIRDREDGNSAQPTPAGLGACLGFGALGLAGTLAFWFVHAQFLVTLPDSGPFAAAGDPGPVWQGYTALHDPHRRFPPGNGHVMLLGTLFLCGLSAFFGPGATLRRVCGWLTVYVGGLAVAVWGTMLIHAWRGVEVPFLLIAWMPYRLINQVPALLLPLMLGVIALRWPRRGPWLLMAAVLVGLLQPLWPHLLGTALHQRYLAGGEAVAFGMYGVAVFAVAPVRGRATYAVVLAVLLGIVALAMYHHFGAACMVAGILLAYRLDRIPGAMADRRPRAWPVAALLAAGFVGVLAHQFAYRQSLPVSPFEAQVRKALDGETGSLLLAPPDSILLQATTQVPVLAEAATPSLISYVPAIGPAIDALYRDIYGSGFQIPPPGAPVPVPWASQWPLRSRAAWADLARRYGFSHVMFPVSQPLDLPQILAGDDYALYAVSGHGSK